MGGCGSYATLQREKGDAEGSLLAEAQEVPDCKPTTTAILLEQNSTHPENQSESVAATSKGINSSLSPKSVGVNNGRLKQGLGHVFCHGF